MSVFNQSGVGADNTACVFLPFNTTEQLLSVAVNLKFVSLFEQTKIKSHVYSVVNGSACVHALINF